MDMELKDKVALVAGGSRGLGRAVAARLSREGAKVAICGRDEGHVRDAELGIKAQTHGEVLGVHVNLTDPEQARHFVRASADHFGTVDILVNNAGGPPVGTFLEVDEDYWTAAFMLILMSAVALTREAAPIMRQKRWGRIINIASVAVKQPMEGMILSNSLRAGVVGFAKTASNELAPYNVTVNTVCPGYTMTDRVKHLAEEAAQREKATPEQIIQRWESQIPAGRLGTPEEFADLVTFLASERAGYITGTVIQIDGGYYKGLM